MPELRISNEKMSKKLLSQGCSITEIHRRIDNAGNRYEWIIMYEAAKKK